MWPGVMMCMRCRPADATMRPGDFVYDKKDQLLRIRCADIAASSGSSSSSGVSELIVGCRELVVATYRPMIASTFANGFHVRNTSATAPLPRFEHLVTER